MPMLTAAQIEERRGSMGGSDAPVVCGQSRFATARALWSEKVGEVEPLPRDELDLVPWLGHAVEPVLADRFSVETGRKLRVRAGTFRSKRLRWATCHIDRDVVGERAALEAKMRSSSEGWGPSWSTLVPADVVLQCQHVAFVMKYDGCYVAVLLPGPDVRFYFVERDDDLIAELFDREAEFMACVRRREPPALAFDHPTATGLLGRLFPKTNGRVREGGDDALAWTRVYLEATAKAKEYEQAATTAKAHLLAMAGNASMLTLPDGTGWARSEITRQPYEVEEARYIQFRHTKNVRRRLTAT